MGISQQEKDSLEVAEDKSGKIEQRKFDEDLNKRYTDNDFDYSSAEGEAKNFIDRFLTWLSNGLREIFGIDVPPGSFKFLEFLIYILMSGLAIYLLSRFVVNENLSSIFSKKATTLVDINWSEEHIEQIDLDGLIASALAENNYRLAIRYHYLRVLKNLSLQNLIDWQFEKTNLDYQREISDQKVKPLFEEVSYLYDNIWYGEQDIDELKFTAAKARFAALKTSISK